MALAAAGGRIITRPRLVQRNITGWRHKVLFLREAGVGENSVPAIAVGHQVRTQFQLLVLEHGVERRNVVRRDVEDFAGKLNRVLERPNGFAVIK